MNTLAVEQAMQIYKQAIVIDGLAGTTFAFGELNEAGITAAHITLAAHNEGFSSAIESIKNYYSALQAHPNQLLLVRSVRDIYQAKEKGKVGLVFGFQTTGPIENDLTNLWIFAQLGVRIIQLTYKTRNPVGYSCFEDNDLGLTYFGKTLIKEMNRVGLLVDLSHTGWKTSMDAASFSTAPVVLSHSNPYTLAKTRRNAPDELICAVAATGGVIGINAHPAICKTRDNQRPTLQDYVDMLDYTVDLVGIDHVGVGPDLYQGFSAWQAFRWHASDLGETKNPWGSTENLAIEQDIRRIPVELSNRGYDETSIQKILGLNFLRVFEEVWQPNLF